MTVTSRGQQERGPLEAGFLSAGDAGEFPPDWWQVSPSAMGPAMGIDWLASAVVFQLAGVSKSLPELEASACMQPIRQPKAAIANETTVAIPAFTTCQAKCIQSHPTLYVPTVPIASISNIR